MNIDLASMSSHKIYGPRGVGALFIRHLRPKVTISPLIFGGGQERELRPGTSNIPGIVGFGKATVDTSSLALTERLTTSFFLSDIFSFYFIYTLFNWLNLRFT